MKSPCKMRLSQPFCCISEHYKAMWMMWLLMMMKMMMMIMVSHCNHAGIVTYDAAVNTDAHSPLVSHLNRICAFMERNKLSTASEKFIAS